jgi:hypothetical protein
MVAVHEASHSSTTSNPLIWKVLGHLHDFGMTRIIDDLIIVNMLFLLSKFPFV